MQRLRLLLSISAIARKPSVIRRVLWLRWMKHKDLSQAAAFRKGRSGQSRMNSWNKPAMLLIVFELAGTTSRYAHLSRERLREVVEVVRVG